MTNEEISVSELVAPLARGWRTIALMSGVCAALALILRLILPNSYLARTTFVPEPPGGAGLGGGLGGLAALAGQFNLTGANANTYSPEFFAELVRSREVVGTVLKAEFPDPLSENHLKRPLLDLLRVQGMSPPERLERGIQRLRKISSVDVDRRTGIVTLAVWSRHPTLSADAANAMVSVLDSFNIQHRQSQSHQQRVFTGRRLIQAKRELTDAENAQLRFLTSNRAYSESPLLRFEVERLQREVQLKQEVYLTLSKTYEQARIAEVQDIPLLTVIDRASPPFHSSSLSPVIVLFMGLVGGAVLGTVFVFLSDYRAALRQDSGAGGDAQRGPGWRERTHV